MTAPTLTDGIADELRKLADYFSPPSGAGTDHAISCTCVRCEWADTIREGAACIAENEFAIAAWRAMYDAAPRETAKAKPVAWRGKHPVHDWWVYYESNCEPGLTPLYTREPGSEG